MTIANRAQHLCKESCFAKENLLKYYCLLVGLIFIVLNLQNLDIGFLPADDHEILVFSNDPMGQWLHSEAFNPWSRWRPIYYTLRALEAAGWSSSSSLWHFARLIGVAVSLILLSASIMNLLGPRTGVLCASTFLLLPVLPSLVNKLGPAETYCLIGFAIWSFGTIGLLQRVLPSYHQGNPNKAFVLTGSQITFSIFILLGSLLAAGSKENFAILLVPNGLILYLTLNRSNQAYVLTKRSTKFILTLAFGILIPMWIFLIKLFLFSGVDVYAKTVRSTPGTIFYYTHTSLKKSGIVISFITLITSYQSFKSRQVIFAFLLPSLVALSLWSILFNRDTIPYLSNHRYALMHQLSMLISVWACVSYWTEDLSILNRVFQRFILFFGVSILLISSWLCYGDQIFEKNKLTLDSNRWHEYLVSTTQQSAKLNLPILLISTHWLNGFESTDSASKFLKIKYQVSPDKIFFSYFPDVETRLRSKDLFQINLEKSISARKNFLENEKLFTSSAGSQEVTSEPSALLKHSKYVCSVPMLTDIDFKVISQICRKFIFYQ